MLRSYQQTLDYLYETLPMFHRIGAAAYRNDLKNTIALCEALGTPYQKFVSIHVAGTNGKGSTSHMLAAILQSAGYKTGLYTSPHLKEFTERIRINGVEIEKDFVVQFVDKLTPLLEEIQPSFFETTVGMAFDYFAFHKVDVAVIEVGLGGRLDSTNVITPVLSVITNISFDHKDLLGDTLPKIAAEKAGIIKPGVPVVVSERQAAVEHVFVMKAKETTSDILFASDHIRLEDRGEAFDVYEDHKLQLKELVMQLKGHYQRKNLPGVLAAVGRLQRLGFSIPEDAIRKGVGEVISLTGLKGRWQTLRTSPLTICDTGHNPDGITEVMTQVKSIPYHSLHMVFGVVKEKELGEVLRLLPRDATYYFCQAKIPRALDANLLADAAAAAGLSGIVVPDVNEALQLASGRASEDDLIFVGGSTYVVAEIDGL